MHILKAYISVLLLSFGLSACYAQDYVSRLVKGKSDSGCAASSLIIKDDMIWVDYGMADIEAQKRGLMTISLQGDIIADTVFGSLNYYLDNGKNSICIKEDTLYSATYHSHLASGGRIWLMAQTLDFDTLFTRFISSAIPNTRIFSYDLLLHPDGGFVISAVTDEDSTKTSIDLCFIRLDENLNEVYRKIYGLPGVIEEPNALAFLGGENYVLHYKTKKYVTELPFYEGEYHENYLLKINENGTYSNRKINRFKQMEGGALNLLVENNRILFGSNRSRASKIYDTTTTGVVMEYSLDLDLIDIHPISELSGWATGFHSIKQHPDGGYALIGQYIPQTDDPFDDWSGKIWYARVDEQWNLQESSLFIFPGYDAPNLKLASIVDFDFLPSGELIGVGQVLDLGSSGQRIWYLKQGSDGCFDAACNWLNLQEQNPQQKPALLLYPNPVQDQVQIAWQGEGLYELRIYDMQGRCVSTISQNPAAIPLQVFVPHFKPGMYTLQVLQNGQLMASAKMIKQ